MGGREARLAYDKKLEMAARGAAAAVKGGGDKRPGIRVLPVAVGCFLFLVVFLLSTRRDVAVVLDAGKCARHFPTVLAHHL